MTWGWFRRWIEKRREIRRRWKMEACLLIELFGPEAYYEAQRRAARARFGGDRDGYWHWSKTASEVARLSPDAEMEFVVVEKIVHEEKLRSERANNHG